MSSELEKLREAAEKYTYHDAGSQTVWPRTKKSDRMRKLPRLSNLRVPRKSARKHLRGQVYDKIRVTVMSVPTWLLIDPVKIGPAIERLEQMGMMVSLVTQKCCR